MPLSKWLQARFWVFTLAPLISKRRETGRFSSISWPCALRLLLTRTALRSTSNVENITKFELADLEDDFYRALLKLSQLDLVRPVFKWLREFLFASGNIFFDLFWNCVTQSRQLGVARNLFQLFLGFQKPCGQPSFHLLFCTPSLNVASVVSS